MTDQKQGPTQEQKQLRGAFIHIEESGKYGIELKGVTPMELYAVIGLLYRRMSKDFNGE